MLNDEQARGIALFFLFSLMDEKIALQAAHKAVASAKATAPRPDRAPADDVIIKILKKNFDVHRRLLARNRPTEMPTSWILPNGVTAAGWSRFHKDSSDGEIIAVVLSKVLGYSDESVAEGLGVSIGTLKYRVGKGVKQLGVALSKTDSPRASQ